MTKGKIDTDSLKKNNTDDIKKKEKLTRKKNETDSCIESKNIIRSKLECQRLAKTNMEDWKIFITLTFDPKKATCSLKDIVNTNKRFRYFIDKVQRIKKDLKYICVPEFHKSGIVHYHLLTNIDINDKNLIYSQEDNPKFKHIKYWNDGFTSVEIIKGDPKKIIGYIAKYMTKDIDNRLFNRHRYLYSRNLKKPIVSYLDLSNNKHFELYNNMLSNKKIIYENEYLNPYTETSINFKEFL